MCSRIQEATCLCASPPPTHLLHLTHTLSLSIIVVQPSHRVHVSWQYISDSGSKEEKRGKQIIDADHNLFDFSLLFFFFFLIGLFCPRAFLTQIIEKRRRDRINHSLSELRRLVPSAFEKQVTSHECYYFILLWIKTIVSVRVTPLRETGLIEAGESRDPADDCGPSQTPARHGRKRFVAFKTRRSFFCIHSVYVMWNIHGTGHCSQK